MRGRRGFTVVETMIVVAMIGVIASIAVVSFRKARETSQTNVCLDNLRRIEAAKKHWALANGKVPGDGVIEEEVDTYIKGGAPSCPANGIYTYGAVGTDPTCSVPGHVLPYNCPAPVVP
jgi:prepilin-type N-terminal cleavage/methylation domain-containing protein